MVCLSLLNRLALIRDDLKAWRKYGLWCRSSVWRSTWGTIGIGRGLAPLSSDVAWHMEHAQDCAAEYLGIAADRDLLDPKLQLGDPQPTSRYLLIACFRYLGPLCKVADLRVSRSNPHGQSRVYNTAMAERLQPRNEGQACRGGTQKEGNPPRLRVGLYSHVKVSGMWRFVWWKFLLIVCRLCLHAGIGSPGSSHAAVLCMVSAAAPGVAFLFAFSGADVLPMTAGESARRRSLTIQPVFQS